MIKAYITSFLLIIHMASMVWYFSLSREDMIEHRAMCMIVFYGLGFLILGLNNALRSISDNEYQLKIYYYHNLFAMVIGSVFILHYLALLPDNNKYRMWFICLVFLIIFVLLFNNMRKFKFFKK